MFDKMKKERGRNVGRTSQYHGVGFRKDNGRWRAYYYSFNKEKKHLGCFKTELEAAEYRNKYIVENNIQAILNNLPPKI